MNIELPPCKKMGYLQDIVVEAIDYDNPYDFKKLHRHSYFELLLFEEAHGGKQIIDFIEYEISPKSIYLIIPGQVHLMKRLPKENGILIQFSKSILTQSISPYKLDYIFELPTASKIELSDEQFETLNPLFKKLKTIYKSNSSLRRFKLIQLLGYVLFEILELTSKNQNNAQKDNCVYQFLNAVDKHFKEIKTVRAYANMLKIPINKLTKKIKIHLGKAPLQIIHEMILIEIKRLLTVEQLSHKEIAFELNFDSQSSYSRFIKKHTNLSPSELKQQLHQIAQ